MSRFMIFSFTLLLLPNPLAAQEADAAAHGAECLEEVRQIHATDLDVFKRPPHRTEMYVFSPDGTQLRIVDTLWGSPFDAVSGIRGDANYSMLIGQDFWTGPTMDGPWTKSDYPLQEDRQAQVARMHAEETSNISDVACPVMVSLDGKTYISVGYRTQTNKDANGTFFGAMNTVYLDPKTRLPIRWDMTEFINSWKPGIDHELQITVFTYDPTIRLPRPD
ncbi:MAG: hypothetical protein K9G71_01985 [Rhodobacteraceae bacterium]|nr:hypothetical protein [Paracoccaceae bacterium]MCF8513099.1 hypothetical protein [Paracoccaceae bacterium]MCF8517343.1 hypothetical protein [Paracoccaceae bacterium]